MICAGISWENLHLTSTTGEQGREVWRHVTMVALFLYDNKNQRRRRKENGKKAIGFYWQNSKFARASCYFVHFFAVVAPLRHENSKFHTLALWSRWIQHKSCLFLFRHLNTVLSDSTWENFANICQIKWKWMGSMKFETVRIHFLSDVFGLLSSKNFAKMTTWRNDFSISLIPSDLSWLVICPLKALFIFVILGVGSG